MILNATEACNLRCRYCSFSGAYPHNRRHGTRSMTLAMAKKAADWYLSFDRPKYGFAFYGGEPLLVRDRIAQLLQYIKQQTDRPVSVNMTTNGTLLDAAFVDWCVAHDVVLTISLDGPQTVHDRYRVTAGNDGTFSTVFQRVRWLQENYPEWYRDHVLFNMVVAPPFRFAEIHAFITENAALFSRGKLQIAPLAGDPSAVHAALGIPSVPTADDRAEMGRAMCHFDADLRRAGGSGPFLHALIGDGLLAIHKRDSRKLGARTPSHGQCIPGQRKCFVDTDGQLYMCEKVQNRAIGRIGAGLDEDEIAAFLRDYSTFLGEHCRNCWAIRLCQKCFNSIRDGDRLSEARLGDVCRGMRRGLVDKLTRYCAIREQTDEAFRWADDVELQ
nr:radical SAM protein [Roseospira goensis]